MNKYIELCKPKVVMLMLATCWVGMFVSGPTLVVGKIVWATFGIAFLASSAAVVNHIIDKNLDKKMARTAKRPVAYGDVSSIKASVFATLLLLVGSLILYFKVNVLTLYLTLTAQFGYAVFYTMWLKHQTPQNIVIGGAAGAMPPVLGWSAMQNEVSAYSLLLFLIIFTWTPPHFWALAIYRNYDYKRAQVPMLPVTHGINFTKLNILMYTILLVAISILPYLVGYAGKLYLLAAIALNIYFANSVLHLYRYQNKIYAIKSFKASIWYLLLLFSVILFDSVFYKLAI